MRLIFLGSPEPAVGPLKTLISEGNKYGHELLAVVSQPPRPSGRNRLLQDPPVAKYAKLQGVTLLQPEKASDPAFLAALENLKPDVAITAAYGQILTPSFLSIPKRATINIHPSFLPKYRGATPVPAALLAGDKESGVTILFTVQKVDAGSIICQIKAPIGPHEMAGDLTNRFFNLGTNLLMEALEKLKDPDFVGTPQNEQLVTHCKKISKSDGLVDWSLSADEIYNHFRAYHPWPGTYTFLNGRRIQIIEMKPQENPKSSSSSLYGSITIDKPRNSLVVTTSYGNIEISKVKPAGGHEILALSLWNGLKNNTKVAFTSHE